MTLRTITAALLATLCLPALSANHNLVIAPVDNGPFPVACTNIEQDPALIASFGGTPAQDFWEGKPANGQLRYISQILRNPGSVMKMNVQVPDNRDLYARFSGEAVEHVVIVCHPTPANNFDPGYVLPQTGSIVPHMQPAGMAPKITGDRFPLILFSHGLAGSPISPGHLEALVQLAAHGYVVAAVFHGDPRFSRVRIEDVGDFAFVISRFDEFVEMEAMRPLSLKALTDLVLAHPTLSAAVDANRIGAFGASLGGQAVMNLGGARLTTSVIGFACRETARDPRVKAIVGLVPYAGQTFLPAFCNDSSGADSLTVPFLGLAGTRDTTAPISMARQAVNRIPASHYLVEMDIPHEFRPEYAADIFTWTTTFLNAYLKVDSDPGAMSKLIVMSQVAGGPADSLTIDVHVPFENAFGEQRVTEFYHPALNHYFMTIDPAEVPFVLGNGWLPTGQSFKGWRQMPAAQFEASPVCRFYGGNVGGPNSHFYTAEPGECDLVRQDPHWFLESLDFYTHRVSRPDLGCPAGYLKVNRAYNNRWMANDSNHRFTTSDSTWREMERHGWVLEGAVMCARP